jgi:hypothetical protein
LGLHQNVLFAFHSLVDGAIWIAQVFGGMFDNFEDARDLDHFGMDVGGPSLQTIDKVVACDGPSLAVERLALDRDRFSFHAFMVDGIRHNVGLLAANEGAAKQNHQPTRFHPGHFRGGIYGEIGDGINVVYLSASKHLASFANHCVLCVFLCLLKTQRFPKAVFYFRRAKHSDDEGGGLRMFYRFQRLHNVNASRKIVI